ncbi:MAG: hypothetical protein ABI837_15420 [Acidobacteriota bacterium]
MSKKRDKEQFDRINAAYNAIFNDIEDLPIEEVRRALADAGVDRTALREGLHESASALARGMWAKGQGAPEGLKRLIDQTGDPTILSADPVRAFDKAKQYLGQIFGPVAPSATPGIVGAFRGEGELTPKDQETIDAIDAELLARVEADDEPPPES